MSFTVMIGGVYGVYLGRYCEIINSGRGVLAAWASTPDPEQDPWCCWSSRGALVQDLRCHFQVSTTVYNADNISMLVLLVVIFKKNFFFECFVLGCWGNMISYDLYSYPNSFLLGYVWFKGRIRRENSSWIISSERFFPDNAYIIIIIIIN